jgi:hypothetical protein
LLAKQKRQLSNLRNFRQNDLAAAGAIAEQANSDSSNSDSELSQEINAQWDMPLQLATT